MVVARSGFLVLSVLFVSSIAALGEDLTTLPDHNGPAQAPTALPPGGHYRPKPHQPGRAKPPCNLPAAPQHPPVHPPGIKPPVPFRPPRSFVAVQGVVYCKPCKYRGVDTLLKASPLKGAVAKLQCNNTRYPQVAKAMTNEHGYFYLEAPKTVTSYGAHKCAVSLVSSPEKKCGQPTDLHGGIGGATLRLEKHGKPAGGKHPVAVYSVGPFAFDPPKNVKCMP